MEVFDGVYLDIGVRLLASLVVGRLIGLERSYHGRPAGFRTHSLVCLSTSLLMLVTVYETRWFSSIAPGRISLDPTRMAQGIMTGIGFLGGFTIANLNYRLDVESDSFEYQMVIRTNRADNASSHLTGSCR